MWIVCLADNSHEMSTCFLWDGGGRKLKLLSAAVIIGTLRVNKSDALHHRRKFAKVNKVIF